MTADALADALAGTLAGTLAGAAQPAGARAAMPAAPDSPGLCPRCGGGLHCGMAGPAPCACSSVRLAAHTLAGLRQRYSGCLCLACLTALAGELAAGVPTGPPAAPQTPLPAPPAPG